MDDVISRQAVLDAVDAITKWSLLDRNGCHVGVGMKYRDVKETVKSLPPSPSRPTGYWMRMSDLNESEDDRYKCSCCGNRERNPAEHHRYRDARHVQEQCGVYPELVAGS